MLITAKGMANPDGTPKDVDREFVSLYTVMDENESWFLEHNTKQVIGHHIAADITSLYHVEKVHLALFSNITGNAGERTGTPCLLGF